MAEGSFKLHADFVRPRPARSFGNTGPASASRSRRYAAAGSTVDWGWARGCCSSVSWTPMSSRSTMARRFLKSRAKLLQLTASHRVPPLLSCHRDSKPVASREHHKGRRCDGLWFLDLHSRRAPEACGGAVCAPYRGATLPLRPHVRARTCEGTARRASGPARACRETQDSRP
jgi:hypothetical protein